MLDNSLDFSGVCTTPVTKSKGDTLPGNGGGLLEWGGTWWGLGEQVMVAVLSGVGVGMFGTAWGGLCLCA